MSIKINHVPETLTPENGVLDITAVGALKLPSGDIAERPANAIKGYFRFAEDLNNPEYHDGDTWHLLANKQYVDSKVNIEGDSIANTIANLKLDDLSDVTITSPVTGQVLSYDVLTGQFRTQTQTLTAVSRAFMGDGATLDFDIQTAVSSATNLVVTVNGIQQQPFYSYTVVNGSIVAFDEAPEEGDRIEVRILRSNVTTDRARPTITAISYSNIAQYTTITIQATDISYGTSAKIGNQAITRIDYPAQNIIQLMIETSQMNTAFWQTPKDLTLVDTSGNEFVFENLINYGASRPYWTDSNSYIGSFKGGDAINFQLAVNNAVSITISPAYAGESAISWLTVSGSDIVGTAPQNSSPSRYEIQVTASNGSVDITKNYWLLVI